MKTPMLKRRLNPFLLISTVLILSLLAGLSVLYQGQLSNLVSDKQNLQEKLEDKKKRVTQLEQKNANLSSELSSSKSDLNRYIRLYRSEKKLREDLNETVSSLRSEKQQLENTVSSLKAEKEDLEGALEITCMDGNNLTDIAHNECEARGYR